MILNAFQWRSLKTRVTLFTLTIFMLSIWSLAFYANRMLREDMQHQLGAQQSTTVSLIAAQINEELDERLTALEKVAARVDPSMLNNPAALQGFLEQRLILPDSFNGGIFATGPDGTAIADIPLSTGRIGVNFMDRDHMFAALKQGKATISRPVMGMKLKAPVFTMVVPIRDAQDKVIGALAGVTNLGKPNFLGEITNNNYGKTGYFLLEERKNRLVITGSDKRRIMQTLPPPGVSRLIDRYLQGYEETGLVVNPYGVEVLASAKRIQVADWIVIAALPTAEGFAPIHHMQRNLLWATIFLTLLAGGLTWWMLRRQLAPMLTAVKTMTTRSKTNQPPQPLPVTTQDEIGQLIGGFNGLLETLAQREAALTVSETLNLATLDSVAAEIAVLDRHGVIIAVNQAWRRFALENGIESAKPAPHTEIGTNYLEYCQVGSSSTADDDSLKAREGIQAVLDGQLPGFSMEYPCHSLTQQRWFSMSVTPLGADGGGVVLAHTNITERKLAEEKLQLAASVFSHSREGIMITDLDGAIIDVNDAFTRITGFSRDEVLGQNPRILSSGRQGKDYYANMWRSLIDKGHWYGEIWNRHKNGEVYAEMQTISTVRDEQGKPQRYVALFSDITSQKEHQRQLEHIAHYDALTSLPNRVLLADRLHQGMAQAQRRAQLLAVAFLDLDGFKAINDSHGHEAGDQLLINVAIRMKQALREGDTLARLGGDEFVAVLLDLEDMSASMPMISRLLAAAAQPVHVGALVLQVSASLGITFYPQADEVDADQLLRQADQAMYQAKLAGKNRCHVFDTEQDRNNVSSAAP